MIDLSTDDLARDVRNAVLRGLTINIGANTQRGPEINGYR